MSLRQMMYQLDVTLGEDFQRSDLDDHTWFQNMVDKVEKIRKNKFYGKESYEVVLEYVKWKGNKNV
jgi:hypothetical protein